MKVYVVNQFGSDYDTDRYTDFIGTFGVFTDLFEARRQVNQQQLLDAEEGESYLYTYLQFEI